MKIYIGCDHLGKEIVSKLINDLKKDNYEVIKTTLENKEGDDYPDFAFEVCKNVIKENTLGILLCGTGIGMSIAANKVKGIICAKVSSVSEAHLAKEHNGANVIALSIKTPYEDILLMIKEFLKTPFSNEERHLRRIEKIHNIENGTYYI